MILVEGAGPMLALLSRIAISGRHGRRSRRGVPLILTRGTRRWLILAGWWASGRRILARCRPGGGLISWIGRWKVWKRALVVRVWRGVLARETSWVWIPSKRSITSRTLRSRTSPERTRSGVGRTAGGTMGCILSGKGAACPGSWACQIHH